MISNLIKPLAISLLLLFSTQVFSVTFINVDEFYFSHEEKLGLRVSIFDTKQQKYISIDYFQKLIVNSDETSRTLSGPLPKIYFNGLIVDYDGNIAIPTDFNPNDPTGWIVRTRYHDGKITFKTKSYKMLRSAAKEIKTGTYISQKLNAFTSPSLRPLFNTSFFVEGSESEEKKNFSCLSSNRKDNNDERGRIGELATECTMIGYGYNKLSSQDTSNHGLDGVFTDNSDTPELFLTESKCRDESVTAEAILDTELKETTIAERISKAPDEDTSAVVQDFIDHKHQKIFKFAHRIKPNGECQCCVRPYRPWGITLRGIEYFFGSEAQYVQTFLASLSLSEEDKKKLEDIYLASSLNHLEIGSNHTPTTPPDGDPAPSTPEDTERHTPPSSPAPTQASEDISLPRNQKDQDAISEIENHNHGNVSMQTLSTSNKLLLDARVSGGDRFLIEIYLNVEKQLAEILDFMRNKHDADTIKKLEELEKQINDSELLIPEQKEELINRINAIKRSFPEYARTNIPEAEVDKDAKLDIEEFEKFFDGHIAMDPSNIKIPRNDNHYFNFTKPNIDNKNKQVSNNAAITDDNWRMNTTISDSNLLGLFATSKDQTLIHNSIERGFAASDKTKIKSSSSLDILSSIGTSAIYSIVASKVMQFGAAFALHNMFSTSSLNPRTFGKSVTTQGVLVLGV